MASFKFFPVWNLILSLLICQHFEQIMSLAVPEDPVEVDNQSAEQLVDPDDNESSPEEIDQGFFPEEPEESQSRIRKSKKVRTCRRSAEDKMFKKYCKAIMGSAKTCRNSPSMKLHFCQMDNWDPSEPTDMSYVCTTSSPSTSDSSNERSNCKEKCPSLTPTGKYSSAYCTNQDGTFVCACYTPKPGSPVNVAGVDPISSVNPTNPTGPIGSAGNPIDSIDSSGNPIVSNSSDPMDKFTSNNPMDKFTGNKPMIPGTGNDSMNFMDMNPMDKITAMKP